MPDTRLRRARFSVCAVFMIHAAAFGTWGTRIPAIKHHVGIGNGQLGIAFSGLAIGLVVGTRIAGVVVDRFGSRPAIRVATVLLCAVLLGPALADSLAVLTAVLFVLGGVGGFLDVAMNAHTVVVERGYGRPIMSSVHALWSVGLLIGALSGAGAAALGLDPRLHFGIVAAALLVPSFLAPARLLAAQADAVPAEAKLEPSAKARPGTGARSTCATVSTRAPASRRRRSPRSRSRWPRAASRVIRCRRASVPSRSSVREVSSPRSA
ncbi:MAG: MFS transporter [Actinobacteria bacterium]|nr:MAG: MFS transporter [Actinomycetota bacterium]